MMKKPSSMFHVTTLLLLLLLLLFLSPSMLCARAQPSSSPLSSHPGDGDSKSSMKVTMVVLVGAIFFMGLLSIYASPWIYNTSSNTIAPSPPVHNPLPIRRCTPVRGLDASVIESFPTFIYSDVKFCKFGKGALQCVVCLNHFENSDTLKLLPNCDHVFHPKCIDNWLAFHSTCPVCRANLTQEVVNNNRVQDFVVSVNLPVDQNSISQEHGLFDMEHHRRLIKFPRSHSTGHSLIPPGENCDRYTLKLPDEVRTRIMRSERTKNSVVFPRERSCVSGYRSEGEGSSRTTRLDSFERWMLTRTPPFFGETSSGVELDHQQSSNPPPSV